MVRYAPVSSADFIATPALAVRETVDNPTLREVCRVYGDGVADDWLATQLSVAFGRCGFDFQTSADDGVGFCVNGILTDFIQLRIDEIRLFLDQFQKAEYGDYGRVFNSQKFFKALKSFIRVRNILRENNEQEKRKKEQAEAAPIDGNDSLNEYLENAPADSFLRNLK